MTGPRIGRWVSDCAILTIHAVAALSYGFSTPGHRRNLVSSPPSAVSAEPWLVRLSTCPATWRGGRFEHAILPPGYHSTLFTLASYIAA